MREKRCCIYYLLILKVLFMAIAPVFIIFPFSKTFDNFIKAC